MSSPTLRRHRPPPAYASPRSAGACRAAILLVAVVTASGMWGPAMAQGANASDGDAGPVTLPGSDHPLAFFTITPQMGKTGLVFRADASESLPGAAATNITRYEWNFGENATFTEGNVTASYAYRQGGVFVVRLRITDDRGGMSNATQTVLVTGASPSAYFVLTERIEDGRVLVTTNATFSEPSRGARRVVSYEWNWGTGGGFVPGNVTETHEFEDVGAYTITLRVTDDEGRIGTYQIPVTVGDTFWKRIGQVWDDRDAFFDGAKVTLTLAVIATFLGFFLSIALALLRLSRFPLFSWPATAFIEVIRGTPLLVQILIAWLVLPFLGIKLSIFWAGCAALIVNTSAYQAEVIRGGIQSIPTGQMEAALALGMTRTQAMRHVIMPQALRLVIPPLGNEFIILLKDTSLVSVIGVVELTYIGRVFSARTFLVLEAWLAVALIYFILTYTMSLALQWLERRMRIPGLGLGGAIH